MVSESKKKSHIQVKYMAWTAKRNTTFNWKICFLISKDNNKEKKTLASTTRTITNKKKKINTTTATKSYTEHLYVVQLTSDDPGA